MKQTGLTLVELLIVVLLIGILALLSTPLTSAWVDGARVSEGAGAFEQAVGQAKAAGLRNPAAVQGDAAASAICLSDEGVLSVREAAAAATSATCGAGGPVALWSSQLHTSTTIELLVDDEAEAWSCACFTNKGLLTTTDDNCEACGSSLTLRISSGSEYEDYKFH